jgi:hypothetical protein
MERKHSLRRLGLLPVAVALLTLAGWLAIQDSVRGGAPNSVRIEPDVSFVAPGGSLTVSLVAEPPATGTTSWEIDVSYDSSHLTAIDCTPDPEGACDISSSADTATASGEASTTLTEQFVPAEITFQATGSSGVCIPLVITVQSFVSPDVPGDAQPALGQAAEPPAVTDGEVCFQGTPVPTVPATPEATPANPPCPRFADFDPANFPDSTTIDNPLMPLIPGRQLVLDGVAEGLPRSLTVTPTDVTKVINGVTTMLVWSTDFVEGSLVGESLGFFAQDDSGNVWIFGEYPEEYENGQLMGAPNTWLFGIAGAEGGVRVPDAPGLNEPAFLQSWSPEIGLLDCARVIANDEAVCVPLACYEHALVTNETNPIDPSSGSLQSYHVPEIGTASITSVENPEGDAIALAANPELSEEELAEARAAALALDERAYQLAEVYAGTDPAELPPEGPTPEATPEPTPTEPAGSTTPTPDPDETPTPTPEPDESPGPSATPEEPSEDTPAPTSASLTSPTPAAGSTILIPVRTIPPLRTPSRTPLALSAGRAPRPGLRSVRSLPSAGGEGFGAAGPISVGWMVPASLGMVLLGVYVYGAARRTVSPVAVERSLHVPPEDEEHDLMFERLESLKQERREALDETDDY